MHFRKRRHAEDAAPSTINRDSAHGKTVKIRRRRATVKRKIFGASHCHTLRIAVSCNSRLRWEGRARQRPLSQETERNLNLGKYA
jgi:hypothetical protein